MTNMEHQLSPTPHVPIFPNPILGHITHMLNFDELLCLANINVTFLNTTYNHQRLTKFTGIEARFARYPGFKFDTVLDGLPDEHSRSGGQSWLWELRDSITASAKPLIREILIGEAGKDKITHFVMDGWMSWAMDVENETEIPVMSFMVCGAHFDWSKCCFSRLVEAGKIPFKVEAMDEIVKNVPGMDSFLRYRDLPDFCRVRDVTACHFILNMFNKQIQQNKQVQSFIINTFEDLEGPILSLIRSHYCSKAYTIGPLRTHLQYRLGLGETTLSSNSSSSLWEVDQSLLSWLDQKPDKSIVYVSFGSLTILKEELLMEIWAGLFQSRRYFLWVIRPDRMLGSGLDSIAQDDLLDGTKKRGCIVGWASQVEALAHRAVGGFLTHSGWNSTIESIVARVPMLCWPYFADQFVTSRFVSEVWKIGLDMKDTCDRTIVENMINDLMEKKKDELEKSMSQISHSTKRSIRGGSSYSNLNHLIEEIKAMI